MGLPLGLLTLAAILPQEWCFQLADLNTKRLRDSDIRRADIICVGGMTVQQGGILNVIHKARQHGKFVVAGGTDPTSQPTNLRGMPMPWCSVKPDERSPLAGGLGTGQSGRSFPGRGCA